MSDPVILSSRLDASVNRIVPAGDGGFYEARYVRRVPERWICYLSSHSGCSKACRFCHLTATGQTMMRPASRACFLEQARGVFETYRERLDAGEARGERVHFNFMARGEPLENPAILEESDLLFGDLGAVAARHGLEHRHKVSTILPATFPGRLSRVLADPASQLYYSLYSMDPRFRRRWLPRAMDPDRALDLIAEYTAETGRGVVLHWAFIEGENDAEADVDRVVEAVTRRGIRAKFNAVRYNPHDARHGIETPEPRLRSLFDRLASGLGTTGSRIVPRVGFDVKASCGTFVEDADLAA